MGFTWTAPKGTGLYISESVLQELQDNTDYLDNNAVPCITYNATVQSVRYVSRFDAEYSNNDQFNHSYNYGSQLDPYCSGNGDAP